MDIINYNYQYKYILKHMCINIHIYNKKKN